MKIKYKINLFFIIQLVIYLSIIVSLVSYFAYGVSREENISHLETAAEGRITHIETYFENLSDNLRLVLERDDLTQAISSFLETNDQADKQALQKITQEVKNLIPEVERFSLIDLEGHVIASTKDEIVGNNVAQELAFREGKDKFHVVIMDDEGEVKIFVLGPISADEKLLGVGVLVSDLSKLNRIVSDRTGLGETGEVLIATMGEDGEPVYLNRRRFDEINIPSGISSEEFKYTQPMSIALSGESGTLHSRYDYAGNEIMAVVRYLKNGDLGLVAKINENESLATVRRIIFFFFGLMFFFLVISFVLTVNFVRRITKPIELLQSGIKTVENGNLDHTIETGAHDEIGELTEAYNRMTAGIKKSREEIDKKVEEQTKEIQKRSLEMQNQQKAILNILEDVDEEKNNVEKEKDKLNKILYSIGDGVFVIDKRHKIIIYNKAAAKMSGYSVNEAIGKNYKEVLSFVHEKSGKVNSSFVDNAFKTGKIQEMAKDTILINRKGGRIAVADSAAPLVGRDGKVIGCVVVFRDVTQEREIDKAKTEFVSLASHQLRTPLSAINWYAEMLIEGDAGKVNSEQKEYLDEIYKGNQRMVDLVNALLDVSRIELGTFAVEPQEVDLKELLNIVIKELKNKIKEKKIKLSSKVDNKIKKYFGDPKLLNIIFQNLLSNSVKYTPEGGKVDVSIKKGVEEIVITVQDSGMGIPKEQQDKIFSKLFRADNVRETDTEGTGLGLYIIKSIVDQSGGSISFVSAQDKGTTFTVRLPLKGMVKKEGTKRLGS
jgi:PAS domain S-box-containing protein